MSTLFLVALALFQTSEVQTNWVSGAGEPGPVDDFGLRFWRDSTWGVNYSGDPGKIMPRATVSNDSLWVRHNIDSGPVGYIQGMSGIFPGDFDGDGDYDLAGWVAGLAVVRIYRNQLVDSGEVNYVRQGQDLVGPRSRDSSYCLLWCGDLDGDGKDDIVVPGDTVVWFKNLGGFNFERRIIGVATSSNDPRYACCDVGDINYDGHLDIVCGSQPLEWWRNDGSEHFTKFPISTGKFWRVKLGDLNDDGWPDLLNSDQVYQNSRDGSFELVWQAGFAFPDGNWIRWFNADDYQDLLICSVREPQGIFWYENDGTGRNFAQHEVKAGRQAYAYTDGGIANDIDGDGWTDVIGAFEKIGYFRQDSSSGNFRLVRVDPEFLDCHWVYAHNLDYRRNGVDLDIDIVATSGGEAPGTLSYFTWFENSIQRSYVPDCSLESSILTSRKAPVWQWFRWGAERPPNTGIEFYVRTGNNRIQVQSRPWRGPITATGNGSVPLDTGGLTTSGDTCFQYKVRMHGSDAAPVVDWVEVVYDDNVPDVWLRLDVPLSAPGDTVDSCETITPRATVYNRWDTTAYAVEVRLHIGSFYRDSVTVDVPPCTSASVEFRPCLFDVPRGRYPVSCTARYARERRPGDNCVNSSILVHVHDVRADWIARPRDTIPEGDTVAPACSVFNRGNVKADFMSVFRIGSVYAESAQMTNLPPDSEALVSFGPWHPALGRYVTSCSTQLAGDMTPDNNKVTDSVVVAARYVDVGVFRVDSPCSTVICSSQVRPRATFRNWGNAIRAIPAVFRIQDSTGAIVWTSTDTFPILAPGATRTDSFPDSCWVAWPVGMCVVSCSTMLAGDMNPANDKVTDTIFVLRPIDVATLAILSPPVPLDSGASLPAPRAVIHNNGLFTAVNFPVRFTVKSLSGTVFYQNTDTVLSLLPFASCTLDFAADTVRGPRGACVIKCSTGLSHDTVPANNAYSIPTFVMVHNVSAVSILCPPPRPDSVAFVGVTYTPETDDSNPGTDTATSFDATMQIQPGGYLCTKQVTLSPGSNRIVQFDNPKWTPLAVGVYNVLGNTGWALDRNPLDDTVRGQVTVLVRTLTIWPDNSAWVFPCSTHIYQLWVENSGSVQDITDIFPSHTRANWTFVLTDTLGDSLPDANSNGIPDLGWILPGDSASFLLRVTVPAGETAFKVDSTVVTARSSNEHRVHHEVGLRTNVWLVARLSAHPAEVETAVKSGGTASYPITVNNYANYPDTFDLIPIQSPAHIAEGWKVLFSDFYHRELWDRNHNGFPDIGPVVIRDSTRFLCKVIAPQSARPGEADTSFACIRSCDNPYVADTVRAITTALGAVLSFRLQPTQTDRCYPGEMRNYLFNVLTEGNVNDTADLTFSSNREGWEQGLFNQTGLNPLPDPGGNGVYRLGPVIPGTPDVFVLKMRAPENIADDLAGEPESLTTCTVIVNARSEFDYTLAGTCTLKVQVVPRLAIHNYENPFHDRTQFIFSVSRDCNVRLYVYTQAGELVARLIDNKQYLFGIHRLDWDGKNDGGRRLPPGTYLYVLDLGAPNKSDPPDRVVKKLIIR